jgi:hypothetical protein
MLKEPQNDHAPLTTCSSTGQGNPASQQNGIVRVREYIPPRNPIEAGVAEILGGLVKVERVGCRDNFLLLGGESLLAGQAAWKIRDRFNCEVSMASILTGTVADIAAEIETITSGGAI